MIMGIHFQSVYWIVNGFFRGLFVLGMGDGILILLNPFLQMSVGFMFIYCILVEYIET